MVHSVKAHSMNFIIARLCGIIKSTATKGGLVQFATQAAKICNQISTKGGLVHIATGVEQNTDNRQTYRRFFNGGAKISRDRAVQLIYCASL